MYRLATPLLLMCETPLHAGSGSDVGLVDLPIQRERHTDFPKIESSSLKGGLREAFEEPGDSKEFMVGKIAVHVSSLRKHRKERTDDDYQHAIRLSFGKEKGVNEQDDNDEQDQEKEKMYTGALAFTDARLLLFPVKSMKGVFAWITCPKALQQFAKDLKFCHHVRQLDFPVPETPTAPHGCQLLIKGKIILEEYAFDIQPEHDEHGNCTTFAQWLSQHLFPPQDPIYDYWRKKMLTDVVVLHDDDFRDFVKLSTEVVTRTRIDNETGTVARGALFTEEYLPAESVLYALVLASPIFKDRDDKNGKGMFRQREIAEDRLVMEFFRNGVPEVLQLGGNATIGKGIVRAHVMEGFNHAK